MAQTNNSVKEETKVEKIKDNRVEIHIPKGAANDDPNFFIGLNGVNYILPRGKTSKVPPEIAEVYNRSIKAQEEMDEHIDAMLKDA